MALRILIADDNAPVRRALLRALESAGSWEFIEAENGAEAVAKAQAFSPNLIILDLVMPEMDGLRASREICKILPDVPIIMHTLHDSPRVALEALKAGVRKVVPKTERAAILAAVQELLATEPAAAVATIPVVPPVVNAAVPPSEPTAPGPPSTTEHSRPCGEIVQKDQ